MALGVIVAVVVGLVGLDFALSATGSQRAEHDALDLVDRIDEGRGVVLDAVDAATTEIDDVATLVHAWSAVSCGVETELSDGDGPSTVIGYLQTCRMIVHRVYALPSTGDSAAGAEVLVDGKANSLDDGCEVSILNAVDIPADATGDSWNTTDLTWMDTAGEPVDDYETCELPEPGGVRSQVSVDEPQTDRYYLALTVVNQGDFVGIGCGDGQFLGFGACSTPPRGAPYLPRE
ncbi:hypothetical protein J2X46_004001 [Nocardioides sp. BE266]|uniref:hypothetical protein n=1 Tax=Nocardioides sp. BE266 TaxID=2817725 RepID=UPI002858E9D7|nr:hypothetical protein [Nocardioides sp. BE266]MDR7254999.1 hypothetical protein [Nocardioides sp. BE266]